MSETTTITATPSTKVTGVASVLNKTEGSKTKSRYHIPWPATKEAHRQWQLEQMAGAFRVFAKLDFADGGSGHISLRGRCLDAR